MYKAASHQHKNETTSHAHELRNGYEVFSFKGVSEKIGRVLKQQSLRVSYQPQRTINSLFPRPKQRDETDRPSSGVVYRISYSQCDFVYYGQTERALKTQVSEHKQAVVIFDHNSKLARAMFTSIIIVSILKTSNSSDMKHITISGFFYRLGCL